MEIRKAIETDIPKLLVLMRELAVFEKYIETFGVTEDVLREQGFRHSPPGFHCLVACEDGEMMGMLVYYFIPFTARARPSLVIKELYVAEPYRSQGIGQLLMKAVAKEAIQFGCAVMKWQVAPWNAGSIRFYERLGAKINRDWVDFEMGEENFRDLSGTDWNGIQEQ